MKVLVVDDDRELLGLICFALRQAGYWPVEAGDGLRAVQLFEAEQPDLVILDVNLPGLNGFEVCRRLRAQSTTPIMLLTVNNTEEDEVRGLDLGADDYLTKPFSPRTLLARVRALLRRREVSNKDDLPPANIQQAGDLTLDAENLTVRVGTQSPTRLTNLEFRLLQYLAINQGRPLSAEKLTQSVWGYRGLNDKQMLKQLVHRLRQKVEADPANPAYILTVAGVGYKLGSEGS